MPNFAQLQASLFHRALRLPRLEASGDGTDGICARRRGVGEGRGRGREIEDRTGHRTIKDTRILFLRILFIRCNFVDFPISVRPVSREDPYQKSMILILLSSWSLSTYF